MTTQSMAAVLTHPNWDPVMLSLGPLSIHWYAVMYLLAFSAAWWLGMRRTRLPFSPLREEHIEDLIFYAVLGVILGGRFGYVFFYGFERFLSDPLWLFAIWTGGMSFHGGLIGVIVAMFFYARKLKIPFGSLMDFAAVITPTGLGFGRLGNFIGQELWGRPTDVSWAMIFPADPEGLARHPSQLYQAFFEGVVLFALVYLFARRERPPWAVAAVFLIGYSVQRFAIEFVRQPDAHINYEWFGWMTRGQELCIPMFILGCAMLWFAYRGRKA